MTNFPPNDRAGYQPHQPAAPPSVDNHLTWSIISLAVSFLFCQFGLITAIIAVVYSTQVDSKLNVGDTFGAQEASRKARGWNLATIVVCVISIVLAVLFYALVLGAVIFAETSGT